MKTILFSLTIFCAIFLFGFETARACSCMERDSAVKAYAKADAVWVGTISNVQPGVGKSAFRDMRATFLVDEALKGKKSEKLDVFTSSQGTACGYPFENGGSYLVYAYRDAETKELQTSICGRTRRLAIGVEEDEIEILRSLSRGILQPRIYGVVYELIRGLYPLREDYWKVREPMPNVKIIARNGKKAFESVSDSKGRFSIANLQKGKYKLEFIVPAGYKLGGDYWDESSEEERDQYKNIELEISDTDSPDQLTIETRVDGRIKGNVVDENGKPVGKDIMVSLVSKKTVGNEMGDIDYVHAFTDASGDFEFFGIPPGEYYLGFNLETRPNKNFPYPRTYYPAASEISEAKIIVLAKAEKLDGFVLSLPKKVKEVEVKGKVVDAEGNPLKGAVVERYGLYYGEWREGEPYIMKNIKQPTFEGRVETDEKGEFMLKLLKGNKYRINSYLEDKNSNKDLLEGDDVDIEVSENFKPLTIVLDKKTK
jgi:uncharacterized GH25 family protein